MEASDSFASILKHKRSAVYKTNEMDSGLFLYDQRVGWTMAPNWTGRHRTYDFEVSYRTNRYGFRGDFRQGQGGAAR